MMRVGSSITQVSEHVRFHNHVNTIFLSITFFTLFLPPQPNTCTLYSVECSDNRGTIDVFNLMLYMWSGSMVSLHIHNLRGECDTPGPGSVANVMGTTQCKKQLFIKTGI